MSLWDPQQREWLEAMGHSLWVLVGDGPAAVEAVAQAAAPAPEGERDAGQPATAGHAPDEPNSSRPARPRMSVPPAPETPVTSPPARPRADPAAKAAALEAARRGAARQAEGPLREALLRATGQPPAVAARTLRGLDVDQTALRDDPAAKRALWLRLRPLRKAATK